LSIVAPLTNLAAGPIFAVLQPTLFLALLLSPLHAAAAFPADAAHVMLRAVDVVADMATRIPFAAVPISPGFATSSLLGVMSMSLVVACSSAAGSAWGARGLIGAAAAAALAVVGFEVSGRGVLELHMIDVGQGDALALRTPAGRWVMFDAGRSWSGGDAGRSTIVPYLRRRGGELHAFVLSHPHSDHVGGGASILAAMRASEYWDGAYVTGSDPYRASLAEASRLRISWRRVHPGDSLNLDGVGIRFLAPDSAWAASLTDPNEASAVALIQYGRVRFLMTGDAEVGEEEWMLSRDASGLRADVLKVGHHGSSTSSTPAFLDAVQPKLALISVGAENTYGHPSPAVVRSLVHRGAQVLRTDYVGTVVVRTDGQSLNIEAGGERWVR
jgi:competence protein ComEC